ncbi:uncharacterized protein LOC113235907 [Hyposmocoma kahamanoa]|uniref:uncharacterized protein LOC113235907 n=1 Tax=Hyposmocoma kahamanoa TaxID=1477025 RepID=UPI000E6D78CB|nr:uncharacterized protein LOC113235907 [Hyposmocoma kahamanoa]
MKRLLIVLALCALTAAMVPRERRALNTEEEPAPRPTTTAKPKEICQRHTPCAWSVYKPFTKIIEYNITNTYCECSPDRACQIEEDDTSVNSYILRCLPLEQQETSES